LRTTHSQPLGRLKPPPAATHALIIGQGLAGSLLAWQLIQRGVRVTLVDDGHRSASSTVAAGLLNPVTGKRLTLAPLTRQWQQQALALYEQLCHHFGRPFFYPAPIARRVADDQVNRWQRQQVAAVDWCGRLVEGGDPPRYGVVYGGGYLDTVPLLDTLRNWFTQRGDLHCDSFDWNELESGDEEVIWRDRRATWLIDCSGWRSSQIGPFRPLPWQPARGTLLTLAGSDTPPQIVLDRHWRIDRHDRLIRFGATFEWEYLSRPDPSAAIKTLSTAWQAMFAAPMASRLEQQSGVRPATLDKFPFIGRHPQLPRLICCNGFGARGTLLIPWYTQRLIAHLLDHSPLPAEADLARFADRLTA
jgi:glycine oxidase